MEEFAGIYNFEMDIGQPGVDSKRQNWQYSVALKKVYITEGRNLPIKFRMIPVAHNTCTGFYVRAVAVYMNTDSAMLPVLRCVNHMQSNQDMLNRDNDHLDHVVSSTHRSAVFEVDEKTQRRSVCVPLTGPQASSDWQTIMFTMMCRSSCNSGINRRPLALVFTLEYQYQVFGRQVIQIRVCASPHRDRLIDENRAHKKERTFVNVGPISGKYYVPVVHYEDYITLVKEARDLALNELPEGPLRDNEVLKFDQILMSASSTFQYGMDGNIPGLQ